MSERFARHLGSRPSDPEYASALSGPKPSNNGPGWWALACALPFVVWMACRWLA